MQLRCKPLEPPIGWGRYTSQAQEVIVVTLNAGDLLQPSWYEAVFDLEVFDTWGTRREVHAIANNCFGGRGTSDLTLSSVGHYSEA